MIKVLLSMFLGILNFNIKHNGTFFLELFNELQESDPTRGHVSQVRSQLDRRAYANSRLRKFI